MTIYTMIDALFFISTLVFSFGLVLAVFGRKTGAGVIFGAGMICQGVALALRYNDSFPLLPVYQGPFFLPFAAGLLGSLGKLRDPDDSRNRTAGNTCKESSAGHLESPSLVLPRLFLVTFLSWAACLFPNDFYLPFLQFKTVFAHLFFLMGVAGKALFLFAGIPAVIILAGKPGAVEKGVFARMNRTVLWGFIFCTLSVFSGAAWSWLGWGAPVVWDDPAMATAMATWLFYSLVLHLHLTRFASMRSRAVACAGGSLFVFCFTCMPELGPFRVPGWQLGGLL